jgi:hypothetical protein
MLRSTIPSDGFGVASSYFNVLFRNCDFNSSVPFSAARSYPEAPPDSTYRAGFFVAQGMMWRASSLSGHSVHIVGSQSQYSWRTPSIGPDVRDATALDHGLALLAALVAYLSLTTGGVALSPLTSTTDRPPPANGQPSFCLGPRAVGMPPRWHGNGQTSSHYLRSNGGVRSNRLNRTIYRPCCSGRDNALCRQGCFDTEIVDSLP